MGTSGLPSKFGAPRLNGEFRIQSSIGVEGPVGWGEGSNVDSKICFPMINYRGSNSPVNNEFELILYEMLISLYL